MKKTIIIQILLALLFSLSVTSCKSKEPDNNAKVAKTFTLQDILDKNARESQNKYYFLAFVVIAVAFLIGRDASKRGMNPWGWGFLILTFNMFALPPYLSARWLNQGNAISQEIYESRRNILFRIHLVMILIGLILIFLSQSNHFDMGNVRNVEESLSHMLFLGILIGGYGVLASIFTYSIKKNIVNDQSPSPSPLNYIQNNEQALKYCQSCGAKLEDSSMKFCGNCGGNIQSHK